ncbi:Ig-like domain-containing protein [Peribacillus sp. SCS-37]|uniref:Ig-like domain-containing protein n=1 Tax=Paraperibacillus esterisolvens TaxID=3115296 RepID=UPI0039062296
MKKVLVLLLSSVLLLTPFAPQVNAADQAPLLRSKIINEVKQAKEGYKYKVNSNRIPKGLEDIDYEAEPNNDRFTANIHDIRNSIAGTLGNYDIDVFKVKIPNSGLVVLTGATNDDAYGVDLGIALFNSDGEIMNIDNLSREGTAIGIPYNVSAGTYYIYVLDFNNIGLEDPYIVKLFTEDELDTTPPAAPKVNQVDDNDTVVTGTAEKGSQVWIQAGDKFIADGKVSSSGKFSIKIPKQKADTYLAICAVDNAENQSEFTEQYVKDKTPPKTLTVGSVTSKSTSVTGKTDSKASVEVKLGSKSLGKAAADSKGSYKVKIKAQKKKSKLSIISKDKAGNANTVTITVK